MASTETEKTAIAKQGGDTSPANVIPVSQPIVALPNTKQSFSMLSDAVDWSQVAACVANKANCVCYGHQAQRLNIVPDTCNAADGIYSLNLDQAEIIMLVSGYIP